MDKSGSKETNEAYHHPAASRGATIGGCGPAAWHGAFTPIDFEVADTIIVFGQIPATRLPHMLRVLRKASLRGAVFVSVNLLHGRSPARFTSLQRAVEKIRFGNSRIAPMFIKTKLGGDFALIKGVAKRLIELDDEALANGAERVIDIDFIKRHTLGFSDFTEDLREENWPLLEAKSGVAREDIEGLARIYANAGRVVATWGMDIAQHKRCAQTVHLLNSLLMMRGNTCREGAGSSKACFIGSRLPYSGCMSDS
ncbi:molybdopterin-binding domain-containing protein [Paraburkholderia acidiphila]|uniref:Uncharacterized protein n=1 Tax=Paraburkholderia acidiphila TaxID=2571747 RepID=A0A7Z2GDC2_9BURK|nr:hypothetical protein [Paraburkholderia acidiphila]QGZ59727.1 hypothetical protein FAZ97_32690 [Paraburkholderia acidiphila]